MGKDSSINLTPGRVRMTGSGGKREKLSAWIWCVCFLGASLLLVFWIVSMMALEVEQPQLLAAVLCLDAWYMVVFLSGKLMKVLVPVSAGIIAGFLFWQRDALRRGLTVIVNLYSRYIQDHYAQGPGFLASEEGPVSLLPALVAISAVLLFFLGYSILRRRRAGMLFFLMIVLLCAGLTVNRFPHPVILLGSIVFCLGIRAMNGRGSGEAGQRMQVRTGILALLLAGAAAAVSFFVLGPALSERILPLHTQVQTFQRQMEADVGEAMERITSGRWSFTGSWSGMVESGMLSNSAAQRDNTEALRLTVSRQPSETVYLKGFVGGLYQGNYWQEISDEDFQSEVESWSSLPEGVSTEEYRELLQQYPYWWQEALGRQPDFFRLELANVNGSYAYLPYFSSLTGDQAPDLTADVETLRGDGTVFEGLFFADTSGAMALPYLSSSYSPAEETAPGDYADYVQQQYLYVPAEGLDRLKEYVNAQIQRLTEENGSYPSLIEVTEMIRESLSGHTYSLDLPPLPAGADFVENFFFDQDQGFCTHFASTTVLMYRLAGYPARYVTGYAAHASDFGQDSDGTYTASVTGADAHAWAEVYMDGAGWIPVEMTPGFSGNGDGEGQNSASPSVTPYETGEQTPAPTEEPQTDSSSGEQQGGSSGPSAIFIGAEIPAALRIFLTAAAIAAAALAVILLRRAWICGKRKHRFRQKKPDGVVRAVLCEVDRLLRDGGIRIAENITDEEYAKEVQDKFPNLEKETLSRLIRLGEKASFSPSPVTKEEAVWCVGLYRELKRELSVRKTGLAKLWWHFIKCR